MSHLFFKKKFLALCFLIIPIALMANSSEKYFSVLVQKNNSQNKFSDTNNRGVTIGNGFIHLTGPASKTNSLWILDKDWKYTSGDDTTWARTNFDDSNWDTTVTTQLDLSKFKKETFTGACWFRLHLLVDSTLRNKPLRLLFSAANGAADVYVDGQLAFGIGQFSSKASDEQVDDMLPHSIVFNNNAYHTIAIRYSNFAHLNYFLTKYDAKPTMGFTAILAQSDFGSTIQEELNYISSILIAVVAFYFAMTIVHFLLFLFYREQKSNLYYFLFTLSVSAYLFYVHNLIGGGKIYLLVQHLLDYMVFGIGLFMVGFLYSVFYERMPKMFRVLLLLNAITLAAKIIFPENKIVLIVLIGLIITELITSVRITIGSLIKKRDGAWIMALGVLFLPGSLLLTIIINLLESAFKLNDSLHILVFIFAYSLVCIPISMSIYLARNFSLINKNLKHKLIEVETLSAKSLQQEQEKKKIVEGQKEELEIQVNERTLELVLQKKEIEEKNKNITDSIQYAKRIQEAMLPEVSFIQKYLPQSFVLFQPRDIVSGDFYWFCELSENTVLIAVADCTGHGVPGAFMSMIGHTLLDEIVREKKIFTPALILQELHSAVRNALKQNLGESRDGMDIALCKINTPDKKIEYAGAMRPIWIYNNKGELTEIKANKQSIGGMDISQKPFVNHALQISKGDTIYLSTDGYADQFGGKEGKKMMVKNFKNLLSEIVILNIENQQNKLVESFKTWRASNEQVDDVLVVGIKI